MLFLSFFFYFILFFFFNIIHSVQHGQYLWLLAWASRPAHAWLSNSTSVPNTTEHILHTIICPFLSACIVRRWISKTYHNGTLNILLWKNSSYKCLVSIAYGPSLESEVAITKQGTSVYLSNMYMFIHLPKENWVKSSLNWTSTTVGDNNFRE